MICQFLKRMLDNMYQRDTQNQDRSRPRLSLLVLAKICQIVNPEHQKATGKVPLLPPAQPRQILRSYLWH